MSAVMFTISRDTALELLLEQLKRIHDCDAMGDWPSCLDQKLVSPAKSMIAYM